MSTLFSFLATSRTVIQRAVQGENADSSSIVRLVSAVPRFLLRPKHGEIKASILEALVQVSHYEDRDTGQPVPSDAQGAKSVGLSYAEIIKNVQAIYPDCQVSLTTVRSYARDAKEYGLPLPYRRPYSKRRPAANLRL